MATIVDGSYLIARTLKEEGVKHLFFLMGGPNYEIVNNSEDMGIKCVDFRHEQAASMAAHAYTRVSGLTGVTTAASGPGTLNLLTGHYNAFIDLAPMVTLGGAGPLEAVGSDGFQEVDQASIFAPVSKAVIRPNTTARMPDYISTAFRLATSGRPGPVYVDCPEDILYNQITDTEAIKPARATLRSSPAADDTLIKKTVELLMNSRSPIILAGGGVFWSKGWQQLRELVERCNIPFYTTPLSRGLIPEDHPMSFLGARSTAFRETDFVLVIGTRFNWIMTFGRRISQKAKLVQIDLQQEEMGHNRSVDIAITSDARQALEQINKTIANTPCFNNSKFTQWTEYLHATNLERIKRVEPLENSQQVPIHPLRLCKELRSLLDRNSIVSIDGNEILHYGRQSIPAYRPGSRLNSGPTGCMGVGLPYAIGAKLASPNSQCVALHGDGSLGMNIQDFDTAVRYNLPITIVVSNNEGWTARVEGLRKPGRELGYTRFDLIAQAMGGYGENVEEPNQIRPAIQRAMLSGMPAIVNVKTDPTARAISQFVGSKME